MRRVTLSIQTLNAGDAATVQMDALNPATALLIADINTDDGAAELWIGEKRLARLIKHGGPHATFWQIN